MRMVLTRIKSKKAQSILEYALIATVVGAALVAMSTYVYRSVQSTQQMIKEQSRNQ